MAARIIQAKEIEMERIHIAIDCDKRKGESAIVFFKSADPNSLAIVASLSGSAAEAVIALMSLLDEAKILIDLDGHWIEDETNIYPEANDIWLAKYARMAQGGGRAMRIANPELVKVVQSGTRRAR
jgi:hypothetical protein